MGNCADGTGRVTGISSGFVREQPASGKMDSSLLELNNGRLSFEFTEASQSQVLAAIQTLFGNPTQTPHAMASARPSSITTNGAIYA